MTLLNIPANWVLQKLGDLIDFKYGKALPDKQRSGDGFPVFGSNGVVGFHNESLTKGETIIVGRKGSVGVVQYSPIACSPIDTTYYIDEIKSGNFKYWLYQLKSLRLSELNKSTAIPGLSRTDAYQLEIKLPPEAEQCRIADKLETVLTRVDTLNDRLARITPLLKRFRQSVLAAATSGRLTEDWRSRHQVSQAVTCLVSDLIVSIDQGWSPKCEAIAASINSWAVMKTTAVQPLIFMPAENKKLPNSLEPRLHLSLQDGDILITRAGPRARAGIACLVRGNHPKLMLCDKAYRIRVEPEKILPEMFNFLLNSPNVLEELDEMKTGISESGVNLTQAKFRELRLSVPTIEEQTEIVRRVEILFAYADRLEARLQTARTAADRLTPALLAKAFRGELVPQDPNDEPATELLRRLREARAAEVPNKKSRGRKAAV